jgi:outer membrane murein-binding lipoprotein Lpp
MANDPYARIAQLEAEVVALRERAIQSDERANRAESALVGHLPCW